MQAVMYTLETGETITMDLVPAGAGHRSGYRLCITASDTLVILPQDGQTIDVTTPGALQAESADRTFQNSEESI
jgi:hypothetical protein